ncbi:hypothetical protein MTO96_009962 [Rhipicephalus appendiculatus]
MIRRLSSKRQSWNRETTELCTLNERKVGKEDAAQTGHRCGNERPGNKSSSGSAVITCGIAVAREEGEDARVSAAGCRSLSSVAQLKRTRRKQWQRRESQRRDGSPVGFPLALTSRA